MMEKYLENSLLNHVPSYSPKFTVVPSTISKTETLELLSDSPFYEMTDEELEKMAEYYGYNSDLIGCEFDV